MKKLLDKLENGLIFIVKRIILIYRYIIRHIARIACYVGVVALLIVGYYFAADGIDNHFAQVDALQVSAKAEANEQLQLAVQAKEDKRIADEKARIEAERIAAEKKAEAERIAKEKKAEAERIAKEKAAKAAAARREAAKKAQEKRAAAAKAEAARKEVIAAEKAKAAAEKAERARISSKIKAQAQNALAEQAEYDALMPESIVDLGVSPIMQKPELPNGCEVTALAILLNYKDYSISKTVLSDKYLPQFPFYAIGAKKNIRAGGDPNFYFCGNPRSLSNAYYCFAGPIVEAGNKVLQERGSSLVAQDITGTDEQGLIDQLDAGNPVITWGTLSMGDAFTFAPNAWVINDNGDKHIPFLNLHCVVLYGYDETFFYIADPLRGQVKFKRSTFMNAYRQIGSRAVIIS